MESDLNMNHLYSKHFKKNVHDFYRCIEISFKKSMRTLYNKRKKAYK